MTAMRLTIVIVAALLVWLWVTRDTIRPSLIMSLHDVLRAQGTAGKPMTHGGFCYPAQCRVG